MYVVPDSTITFHKNIPAFDGRRHLWFPTQASQEAYFASHIARQDVPCQYVKHNTGVVRVSYSVANVRKCTYVTFRNPSFENIIYYGRILNCRYVNNETTEVVYAIDKWLTYRWESTFYNCSIVRESESVADLATASDNPYALDLVDFDTPEDLPTGEDLEVPVYANEVNAERVFKKMFDEYTNTDTGKWMYAIAISPFTPISQAEELWWMNLQQDLGTDQNYCTVTWKNTAETIVISKKMRDLLNVLQVYPTVDMKSYIGRPYNCYIFEKDITSHNLAEIIEHAQISQAEILGIYMIPLYLVMGSIIPKDGNPYCITAEVDTPHNINVRHKKLCRAPFCRLDAVSPFGDRKTYSYEKFAEACIEGKTKIRFITMAEFNLSMAMGIAPIGYKLSAFGQSGEDLNQLDKALYRLSNSAERFEVTAFPQIPYATDTFLTALASANAASLRSATDLDNEARRQEINSMKDTRNMGILSGISNIGSKFFGMASGQDATATHDTGRQIDGLNVVQPNVSDGSLIGSVGGAALGAGMASASMVNTTHQLNNRLNLMKSQQALINDADKLSLANLQSSAVYKNMEATRRAYGYEYNAGTGDGRSMYSYGSFVDIVLIKVKLRDAIMNLYDRYFDMFGLRSRRIAVPRVCNVNPATDDLKPTWWDVDGYKISYIQTEGCCVSHPARDVAEYLEAMFDGGVQFINGTML